MKKGMVCALGLMVFGMMVLGTGPAWAMSGIGVGPITSWDQTLTCTKIYCPRFVVLTNMGGQAVLDKETGLVWEQSPSTNGYNWNAAQVQCFMLTKGGRFGWRLPTIQELSSLMDPTRSNPALPPGHPFSNVQNDLYWSATSVDSDPAWANLINMGDHTFGPQEKTHPDGGYKWCVRGGQGVDAQ